MRETTYRARYRSPRRPVRIRPLGRGDDITSRFEFAVATIIVMLIALAVLAALSPRSAFAQVAPDGPRLVSPHGSGGMGVHWVQHAAYPGDAGAMLVTWAMPALPSGFRLRAGGGQGAGGRSAVLGGIDFQAPLRRRRTPWAIELDWQAGLALSAGDYSLLTLPVGLAGSSSWHSGSVWAAPYVVVGASADLRLGDRAPAKEFIVDPTFEAGLDLAFDVERRVVLRAATVFGERQAVSFGVGLGLGRLRR